MLLSISSISIPSLCSLLLSDDQLFCPYMDVYVLWPRCSWTRSSAVYVQSYFTHAFYQSFLHNGSLIGYGTFDGGYGGLQFPASMFANGVFSLGIPHAIS